MAGRSGRETEVLGRLRRMREHLEDLMLAPLGIRTFDREAPLVAREIFGDDRFS